MKVNTVLGQVDTKDLGITLMHEHIVNVEWSFARAFPGFYDREAVAEMFCEEMRGLKEFGVKTFVDATPINLGRDIQLLRMCSERAEVHIIAATGLYWMEYPFFQDGVDARLLADLMLGEVERGMEGTDAKPGFIKCASQLVCGETEINRQMLRAAAIASKASGLPIYTHTEPFSKLGNFQKRVFDQEGVDPRRVAYGHVTAGGDEAYARALAQGGAFLGADQFAIEDLAGEGAVDLTARLLKSEWKDRILLSGDAALRSDYGRTLSPLLRDREKNGYVRKDLRKTMLFQRLLPLLRDRGVSENTFRETLTLNPRRYFGEEI